MLGIYRFDYPMRGCDLQGIFVEHSDYIDKAMLVDVYLGEVAGKHSEIELTLTKDCLTLVTEDPDAIEIFQRYNMETGINPIEVLRNRGEEDCENDDELIDEWDETD